MSQNQLAFISKAFWSQYLVAVLQASCKNVQVRKKICCFPSKSLETLSPIEGACSKWGRLLRPWSRTLLETLSWPWSLDVIVCGNTRGTPRTHFIEIISATENQLHWKTLTVAISLVKYSQHPKSNLRCLASFSLKVILKGKFYHFHIRIQDHLP